MWTIEFWRNVAERAIKSAAQFAIGAGVGGAANILELDIANIGGAAALGALLSVLTSLGTEALPVGNPGTASLAKSVIAVDPEPSGDHRDDDGNGVADRILGP